MSNTNENTNTTAPQKSDEEILNDAREQLDNLKLGKSRTLFSNNKMRKKMKRWFDRCRKKKANNTETKEGELCYKIDPETKDILMGRKAKEETGEPIQPPYLKLKGNDWCITNQNEKNEPTKTETLISAMSYGDFYKLYRKAVGKDRFTEGILNAWDGFMSWTQVPRQIISENDGKADSVGGHIANLMGRVLAPVCTLLIGCSVGAVKLKEKMEEEEGKHEQKDLKIMEKYKYQFDNESNGNNVYMHRNSSQGIIDNNNIGKQDKLKMLKNQSNWRRKNIFLKNLNNNSRPLMTTKTASLTVNLTNTPSGT